ncbi:hypothetical protein Tco_0952013 [Tanacetum coccineum]|uniref:Integrase, catalytic region, zinc finger, CCHC-type, peptidase aspartic, catalytic n=1 Tax=Tanacetum coccineum TaxID=301880 RepID=A0ABQ5DWH3_9ASTR
MNFVSKFLGTVRFGNDQIARIMGYGDYQLGNIVISKVYYIEGLGQNLFPIVQFCDADLKLHLENTCIIPQFKANANNWIFVIKLLYKESVQNLQQKDQIISETIHVTFDELTAMASKQFNLGPGLHYMTPATSSTGLGSNHVSQQPCLPPIRDDWDRMFNNVRENFNPPINSFSSFKKLLLPRAKVLAFLAVSTSN